MVLLVVSRVDSMDPRLTFWTKGTATRPCAEYGKARDRGYFRDENKYDALSPIDDQLTNTVRA